MDRYEQLQQLLHKHPTGAPKSNAFTEILQILFTPEEVKVALGMGFAPRSIQKIAESAGVPEDEVALRCETMANKGIVFSREKNGEMGYALLPTIPGIFEFPFMKGGGTAMHERLGKLWEEYHHEAMGNEFAGSQTPLTRVIPIQQTIDTTVEIFTYEELSKMMDNVKTFALAQCACRVSVGACHKPKDVCLLFDTTAEFLIQRGFAQRITREQAMEALRKAEEAGLVHTTNNSQDRLNFVCNCCPCCCTILRGMVQLHNPNAFAKSRWQAEVDPDECTGCGICEQERCPVGAAKVIDSTARIDSERCIGCGLCVTTCQNQAVKMVLRKTAMPQPPATIQEMGITVASQKNRLEDFLAHMGR
ncbi:MAG TPA: 4Fe-4S binding protein [Candidatus Hydrogenedentes bacterium]|nr:4Fe-4S binding protein [Candidatus Hydrogenedentota bacterium]